RGGAALAVIQRSLDAFFNGSVGKTATGTSVVMQIHKSRHDQRFAHRRQVAVFDILGARDVTDAADVSDNTSVQAQRGPSWRLEAIVKQASYLAAKRRHVGSVCRLCGHSQLLKALRVMRLSLARRAPPTGRFLGANVSLF